MKKKYTISPVTLYDSDKLLYETYIGLDDNRMTLICSVWGRTEIDSRNMANALVEIMTTHLKPKK